MAQQMPALPPQQPPVQRTYSPYNATPSPSTSSPGGISFPPAKRPRLSPNPPPSPYTNSPYSNSPYATSPTGPYLSLPATHPPPQPLPFNQPQPLPVAMQAQPPPQQPPPGSMGPPQRPAEKVDKAERSTDINDISDLITGSGIDLKEEENYMADTYRNAHQNSSFNSASTTSPNTSFSAWQHSANGHPALQSSGTLSQPTISPKKYEDEVAERHRKAKRTYDEHCTQHLNNPFLNALTIRRKLSHRAYDNGVRLNVDGLFDKIPDRNDRTVTAKGPDGSTIAVNAPSLLNKGAPLEGIISLISLATQERLRGILEDAYALSRARKLGTHGIVPPEWADLAARNGKEKSTTAIPTSITNSTWDRLEGASGSTADASPKDPSSTNATGRLPTPPTDAPPTPQPTIAFPNETIRALREVAARDRKFEEARIAARKKRAAAASKSAEGTPGAGNPATDADLGKKPISKKEMTRLAKAEKTDEVLHRAANVTASMALGGGKKKYSWLSGGGSGTVTPRPGVGGGGTVAGAGGAAAGGAANMDRGLIAKDRRWGEWREDGQGKGRMQSVGAGIQIRDLVKVLELDGREKKTLVKTLAKLSSKEDEKR